MLFLLKSCADGKVYYFLKNKYIVGRKNSDILIENDLSISRLHAIIQVKQDRVTIMDAGSRYSTFIDDQELRAHIEYPLKHGNKVTFGLLGSKFVFEQHSLITAVSGLSPTERSQLKEDLGSIRGQVAEYWAYNCTYLTVKEVGVTMNVLNAIASNVPIVTLQYWSETRKKVDAGEQLPDVSMFSSPPVAKSIANRVQWKKNIDRKDLFKNKMFVFVSEDAKKPMDRLILQLEGCCVAFDKEPSSISVTKLKESTQQVVVVQPKVEKKSNATFNEVVGYIEEKNQRLILEVEIALAILSGSCDTFCNPDFKNINSGSILVPNSAADDHLQLSNKRSTPTDERALQSDVPKRLKNEVIPQKSEAVDQIKPSGGRIMMKHKVKKDSVAEKLRNFNRLAVSDVADDGAKSPIIKSAYGQKGSLGRSKDLDSSETNEIDASWLSKTSCSVPITIDDSSWYDETYYATELIERFKNAVDIVPMKITVETRDGKRNFKKFKKVKPLCPQSKTINSDRLVCVSLRRKASLDAEEVRLSQYQNKQVPSSSCEVVPVVKRGPKRFILAQQLCI